ncbi:MAG: N-acetyltransferase [Mucilaginibacter sp.]|jgi:predicted GNAT family acetyltransferase|nr:N-acetyltransferase [Mucilaginibacter sp.]
MEIKLEQRRSNIGSFYIDNDGDRLGRMDFLIKDGVMNIYHTEVSEQLQGKHMGDKLVEAGVNFARENHLKVLPTCTFARSVFNRVKAYGDVLVESY